MPHGPYRTGAGCTMLEIRYRATDQPSHPGGALESIDDVRLAAVRLVNPSTDEVGGQENGHV